MLLQAHVIYGMRKYVNGAVQKVQVAPAHTHVISAMLWIRADVKTPWPVHVTHRHTGVATNLQLTTDDMLLYVEYPARFLSI